MEDSTSTCRKGSKDRPWGPPVEMESTLQEEGNGEAAPIPLLGLVACCCGWEFWGLGTQSTVPWGSICEMGWSLHLFSQSHS